MFDAQYFHMVCQRVGSSKPHASQAHFKQPKPESPPLFSPPQTFAFLEWIQKREKNIVGLFAGAFQKNLCRFYSIIYASVVCIKDGSNYTPSRCVCLHRKKKVKENAAMRAGRQQFHDTTSKLYGKKFRTASSLPT